jgi:hypothetical protein
VTTGPPATRPSLSRTKTLRSAAWQVAQPPRRTRPAAEENARKGSTAAIEMQAHRVSQARPRSSRRTGRLTKSRPAFGGSLARTRRNLNEFSVECAG